MLAIYKREMRSYFTTWTGFIFLAIACAVSALVFCLSTFLFGTGTADTSSYFSMMIYVMIIFIPIITMRSFSEERKQKTEQLLITAPVSSTQMVLGKYFSAFTMHIIYLLLSSVNFIVLCCFATEKSSGELNFNVALIFGNVITLILVGACFIAIGVFISSLTENQFASIIITITVLLGFMAISAVNSHIENEGVRLVLDWFSLYSRYTVFSYGIFDFSAILYYAMLSGVFVFLTVRVFKARRDN